MIAKMETKRTVIKNNTHVTCNKYLLDSIKFLKNPKILELFA